MGSRTPGMAVGAEQALVGSSVMSDQPTPYAQLGPRRMFWGGVDQS